MDCLLMYAYPRTGQSLFWIQAYINQEYVRENGNMESKLNDILSERMASRTGTAYGFMVKKFALMVTRLTGAI